MADENSQKVGRRSHSDLAQSLQECVAFLVSLVATGHHPKTLRSPDPAPDMTTTDEVTTRTASALQDDRYDNNLSTREGENSGEER